MHYKTSEAQEKIKWINAYEWLFTNIETAVEL